MRLLIDELRLRERPALLKDILETAIPVTEQDVVVICASAHGRRGGRLLQQSYSARILGAEVGGHHFSAIQFTTASAICTALDLVSAGLLPQEGFVAQEQMALQDFLANRFGRAFEAGSLERVQA
jgi:saccharopine dehydrogenase-like NADP-dependent oxidoreductase